MKKASKYVVAFFVFIIILSGTKEYTSLNWFIKPVAWQLLYGYSSNEVPADAGVGDKLKSVTTSIDKLFADTKQKYTYITINGLIHKIMNKSVVKDANPDNDVIKLENDHLAFIYQKNDTKEYAASLSRLSKYVSTQGSEFIYVQAPCKISKYNSLLPPGIDDFGNENADQLLSALQKNNVKYLDLREEIEKQGHDHYSFFFKTDLHWTPQAGFWAFQTISNLFSSEYGLALNEKAMNLENYEIEIYKDIFMGTMGSRVGRFYGGLDDIATIIPKFETDLSLSSPNINVKTQGSFEEILLNYSVLETEDLFNSDPYSFYIKDHDEITILKNNSAPNNKKILLVRDSFSGVMSSFLLLNCEELHIVDLRGYANMSLVEYVAEINPDIVMVMYNPGMLVGNDIMFSFGV